MPMKLYIWKKDVFRDWGSGIAFAIAESEDEARRLIFEEAGIDEENDEGMSKPADEVRDVDRTYAFHMSGSA